MLVTTRPSLASTNRALLDDLPTTLVTSTRDPGLPQRPVGDEIRVVAGSDSASDDPTFASTATELAGSRSAASPAKGMAVFWVPRDLLL